MTTVSTKPYLLRAIWEWCVDQGFTPYLATRVDAHTRVPPGYARDGQLVLNLSPDATSQLQMDNDTISFQARFGGAAHALVIPVANVIAIYARENGQGMAFEPEEGEAGEEAAEDMAEVSAELAQERSEAPSPETPRPARGSHLKVVK
ncbi:ClpXP protease specificity-enhancing factor [Thauera aromatica]|nr:ClpXP protease specificity-enhancing factor [Thauera aromatica]MCK2125959.1 ClpXP protease specificity-enhancing factor [Thauera aromatica]